MFDVNLGPAAHQTDGVLKLGFLTRDPPPTLLIILVPEVLEQVTLHKTNGNLLE